MVKFATLLSEQNSGGAMRKLIPLLILAMQSNLSAWFSEKPIVVLIPSYKNEQWVEKNLRSVLTQRYKNFRVIYIDDHSPDRTYEIADRVIRDINRDIQIDLIYNETRKGALRNIYEAVNMCADDEIIVTLDGDDWLPHRSVLKIIHKNYSSKTPIWLSYGSYRDSRGKKGMPKDLTDDIIERNAFRESCRPSHLRTFYAWLFKKIDKQDLLYKGEFYPMAWDLAMMIPMMEMAGKRQVHIKDVIYTYNVENPISDFATNIEFQQYLDSHIRSKPKYSPIKGAK